MSAPIFIVGANRSGTTLMRLLLNAHSRIAIPEELLYYGSHIAGVPIERWKNPGLSQEHYAGFVDAFLSESCRLLPGLDPGPVKEELVGAGARDLRRPYQRVLEAWAASQGKARWGEKTPGNLFYADIILAMFADAQFIHMVRDPRAGVSSMQAVGFFPNDVVFNALSRRKHLTEGRALLERHVPASQRMTVYYESLVREPVSTIQAVCDFLGEAYEPTMLSFYREASQYMEAEAATGHNVAATQPISPLMIDKWRTTMTHDEVAMVENICGAEMRAFGYEPSGATLKARLWLVIFLKTAYWNIQCWRKRDIRHYTIQYELFARSRRRLQRLRQGLLRSLPVITLSDSSQSSSRV